MRTPAPAKASVRLKASPSVSMPSVQSTTWPTRSVSMSPRDRFMAAARSVPRAVADWRTRTGKGSSAPPWSSVGVGGQGSRRATLSKAMTSVRRSVTAAAPW